MVALLSLPFEVRVSGVPVPQGLLGQIIFGNGCNHKPICVSKKFLSSQPGLGVDFITEEANKTLLVVRVRYKHYGRNIKDDVVLNYKIQTLSSIGLRLSWAFPFVVIPRYPPIITITSQVSRVTRVRYDT